MLLAQNILAEAGLSFLGYGINVPTPSLGNLLSSVWNVSGTDPAEVEHFFQTSPLLFVLPLPAIFSIVLALAVLADALRRSADPHAVR